MSMSLNFAGVGDGGFDAIPAGFYVVAVTGYDEVETSESAKKLGPGVPGINWEFTVQEGEYQGRKLWTNTYFHQSTLPMLKGLLKASGLFTDEQLNGQINFEPDMLMRARLGVKVRVRNYNNEDRNDIQRFLTEDEALEKASGATSGAASFLP
jgi:hypothetical protein